MALTAATLKKIKEKLQGPSPTVLWTGNGYHVYQPIDAFVLEEENIFSKFDQPSKAFKICRTISIQQQIRSFA